MSGANPTGFADWYANLPIPWLVGGPVGKDEAAALGALLDQQVALIKAASEASMPDKAPADALPHIGGDCKLIQGPAETNQNFVTRLKTPWDDWTRAGTSLELLVQLYWVGFPGAVVVQQNGLGYTLSAPPTAGVDPTSLLVTTPLSVLSVALHSNVNLSRSIPAGNSWWEFDNNTDFCSRFAVLFAAQVPNLFTTWGLATFTGAEDAVTVTWNNAFPDTSYLVFPGAAQITDGSGAVVIDADGTTKTLTGISIRTSGRFTGTVYVKACQAGAQSSSADLHPADLARIQQVISTWRPGKATCVGLFVVAQGQMRGWPNLVSNTASMGPATIVKFPGA